MRRAALALVTAIALVVIPGSPASAHSTLVSADPADGTVVDVFPSSVELVFSEPVSASASTVELVDVDGNGFAAELRETDDAAVLDVVVAPLPEGLYSLRWSAFSSTDGHVTRGMLVWGVGEVDLADAAFSEPTSPPDPTEIIGRWLLFGGLGLAVASPMVAWLAVEPSRRRFAADRDQAWLDATDLHLLRARRIGLSVAAAAALALLSLQVGTAWRTSGLDLLDTIDVAVVSSTWGRLAVARLVLLVVAMTMLRRGLLRGSTVALAGALIVHAAGGHAGGVERVAFAVTNDVVHLVAALGWGGAIVLLATLPVGRDLERHRVLRTALARTFSGPAVVLATVTAITGLLSIGALVRSVDALVRSGYGAALSLKVVLVAALALTGLAARRSSRPDAGHRRVGPGLALSILLVAAAVTASSPATGGEWLPPADGTPRQLAVASNDVQIGMTVTPNVPGQNFVLIDAASTRRPAPAAIARVIARVESLDVDRSKVSVEAVPVPPDGSFELATTAFSVPGAYEIEIVVRRSGLPDERVTFPWTVGSPEQRPATISHRPLAGVTEPIGSVAAFALAALLVQRAIADQRRRARLRPLEEFAAAHDHEPEIRP